MPINYQEYNQLDNNEQNFISEHTSTIWKSANEDRKVIPKLFIEEGSNDSCIYIDVIEVLYQQLFNDKQMCKSKVIHFEPTKKKKKRMLINSFRYGWKDVIVSGHWSRTSLQPSSAIELVDYHKSKFK
jgi:hypothetical protein